MFNNVQNVGSSVVDTINSIFYLMTTSTFGILFENLWS